MKKNVVRIVSVILAMALSVTVMVQAQSDKTVDYGEKLDLLVSLLKERHLDMDPDEDPVRQGLIKMFEDYPGTFESFINIMYQSYDSHSYYMEPKIYDSAFNTTPTMVGIGITISQREDGCYIASVSPSGSAAEAGLQEEDKLLRVDGKSVVEYTPSMIGDLVSGQEGTKVKISVLRGSEELSFSVERKKMNISTVSFKNMGDNVAYIKISEFGGVQTFIDFCVYYDTLEESGYKSVILDLRDNPGGDMSCLINMMDQIIPDKDMPYLLTRQSNPMRLKTYASEGYGWEFNKMVILVNENSASAAEVMAGALQDLGYAEVVGVPTHGKGLGQEHIGLSDGSYAIISAYELMLPLTGKYEGKGIWPKHYVEQTVTPKKDVALAKLDFDRGLNYAMTQNVLGVEQRLEKMGYLDGKADGNPDFKTFHAINQFQKERGFAQTQGHCDAATVKAIDQAYKEYLKIPDVIDSQMNLAVSIARKGAMSNMKPTPIDPAQARFTN